jgi:DNA-binding IclR family transcriptional regulator
MRRIRAPKTVKLELFEMVDNPLSRYARILEAVASVPAGLTLSSIAEHTGLQLATSHRLVNSLCSVGFLSRQEPAKIYVLGGRMIQLALMTVTPTSVADAARPILQDLVATFGETSYLAKLNATAVESIAMETPRIHDKSVVQPGRIMPIHATASGKVLCAFQTQEFIDLLSHGPDSPQTRSSAIGNCAKN